MTSPSAPTRPDLSSRQLQCVVSLARYGSFVAAASDLGLSQPSLTRAIMRIEETLGVRLFTRSTRRVALTAAGRAFFARARVVQAELRKAEEEVAQVGGEGQGSVALGVGPTSGVLILTEAVTRFREQFPRSRIRIVEALGHALWPLVRDGTLDLAVSLKPDPRREPALKFRPLYRMQWAVVARKGHPLRNARSLAQLADASWLCLLPPPTSGSPLDLIFSAAGLPGPHAVIECNSHTAMVTLLAKSDMLGTISRWLLAEPMVRDSLQEIAVAEAMPSLTAGVITRADPPLTPVAAAMARAVTAAARRYARSR